MIETVTLANGVRIVMEQMPYMRSIAFGIWVKNGSRNETLSTSGISHFIEHMLFKGTKSRTAKDIADSMDTVGGQINAFTSKEYTCYYTRTLAKHFPLALDVLSDMLFNSAFFETEIDKERNVIAEEISMYEDTPEELVHDIMQLDVYAGNSLAFPVLGTFESISSFSHNTFLNYFGKNYRPDNTVVSVAGNFEPNEIVQQIKKNFGSFKASQAENTPLNFAIYKPTVSICEKDVEQLHLALGFPSIKTNSDEYYAMTVLNVLFGGGMSSRLFQKVREDNGLVYSVYSSNQSFADTGLFTVYAALAKENVYKTFKLIKDEIKLVTDKGFLATELANCKEQLKSNYLLSMESSESRMNSIGRTVLMLNKTFSAEEVISKLEAVTLNDLKNLSEKVFDFSQMCVSAVGDVSGIDFEGFISSAK